MVDLLDKLGPLPKYAIIATIDAVSVVPQCIPHKEAFQCFPRGNAFLAYRQLPSLMPSSFWEWAEPFKKIHDILM